ncbi:response regulator transcription factor [Romboutsia sedimentorum]|jgi:DNA-binding response OmpR family regulator|uniref:response regulator transcription factor n=1 Tax=Romboutsia sedimentorum TaxID=1368474 RepID=UPI0024DE89E9|nr:response regulator transcription factor [Romboutsia sedimentorum]MDK2587031.1 response regulator transcription factor [Romboutsia sedimentorum]
MKLLVVEDNIVLGETIYEGLSSNFKVDIVINGEDALFDIEKNIYDMIILDIMLPDISGMEILERIRKKNIKTPVIMLTAKEALDDKVGAFTIGASDYITKPFYMEELIARIYAILRTNGTICTQNIIKFNELCLNLDIKKAYIKDIELQIENKQFNILEYFLLNKGIVLLKEQIYDRIWGIDCEIPIEIVEVHISKLRKQLGEYGYNKYIKTRRGIGYIFDDK